MMSDWRLSACALFSMYPAGTFAAASFSWRNALDRARNDRENYGATQL